MSHDQNEETKNGSSSSMPSIQASGPAVSNSQASLRPTKLLNLLNSDIPHKQVLHAALEQAIREGDAQAASLYTITDSFDLTSNTFHEMIRRGSLPIPSPQQYPASRSRESFVIQNGPYFIEYQPIMVFGKLHAWLAVASEQLRSIESKSPLARVVYFIGLSLERQSFRTEIEHFRNKFQLLEQINVMMASNADIEEIAQTITTEIALSFNADSALLLLRSREEEGLKVSAQYGTSKKFDKNFIIPHLSPLGRALLLGGTASLYSIQTQAPEGFSLLREIGAECVHWCAVENAAESLGTIVLSFRESRRLSELEREMLGAFAQGAAVAFSNAGKNRRLGRYAGQLEELVEARTQDLAVARKRADDANQAKSQFVANMSHELRTPLTAIVGYSSVIARGVFGKLSTPQKDALNSVTKAAEHLKDLLNDVLDVAKVEAGKERVQPSEIDIGALLKHIHRMMLQTAMAKKVEFLPVELPADESQHLTAWIDQRHLRQILINLCSNAVKYTPSGGSAKISAERFGDKIRISVTDTGIGIPEKELPNLFERFSRGMDEYSQSQLGTGLGLSLTKQLVEINGGQVGVDSVYGEGSTFWILIPAAQDSLDDSTSVISVDDSHTEVSRLDGLQILIADDSKLTCEVLATIIREVGGTPVIANTVREAMQTAQEQAVDAAIIDLAFPGESGIDLLDFFRHHSNDQFTRLPLLVVSACVFDSNRHEALQHGATSFVAKPFDPIEVIELIRSHTASSVLLSEEEQ